MRKLMPCILFAIVAGCSSTPSQRNSGIGAQAVAGTTASSAKIQAIGNAAVGSSREFTNPQTGNILLLSVESEYFSANGRPCRRFTQTTKGRSQTGVGCFDAQQGWVELPLQELLR